MKLWYLWIESYNEKKKKKKKKKKKEEEEEEEKLTDPKLLIFRACVCKTWEVRTKH